MEIAHQTLELEDIAARHRLSEPVYVSRPSMPSLDSYHALLERIWSSRWLTNGGVFHEELEHRIAAYLGVKHLSLFSSGTTALQVALHALNVQGGEVITSPFTFPATVHAIHWSQARPVFCDIDPCTYNLDPNRIEELIGPDTKAIMPVHVYGTPCDVEAIQAIADRHGLHVVYDGAHTFGARFGGRAIASYGGISVLSFHATKLFSTIEGGALVVESEELKRRVDLLKNFGIAGETEVLTPGINGKMNEFQAAYGLLQLDLVDDEIRRRSAVAQVYAERLRSIPGLTLLQDVEGAKRNYAYYPVLVDERHFGMPRDNLYNLLRKANIVVRRYFYPLCSRYSCYIALPSAHPGRLPVAERIAQQVLCLPISGALESSDVEDVCALMAELHQAVC